MGNAPVRADNHIRVRKSGHPAENLPFQRLQQKKADAGDTEEDWIRRRGGSIGRFSDGTKQAMDAERGFEQTRPTEITEG